MEQYLMKTKSQDTQDINSIVSLYIKNEEEYQGWQDFLKEQQEEAGEWNTTKMFRREE
ncbi:hypothetical protein KY349_04700 [Candidatus Woesearchaeota archaeon]|jgi:hypothetical protein|nr:hypothetical protein [Candidatus Woesearchaeota archaeon]